MAGLLSKMVGVPEYVCDDLGMKRKLSDCYGSTPCKVARICTEHGSTIHTCADDCHCCSIHTSVADRCFNYLNSSPPRRILFYNQAEWVDFSGSVLETLIKGFKDDKTSVPFSMDAQPFLLDFLSMVLINLKTKKQQSVAWIDVADKCFFPNPFCDEMDKETTESAGAVRGIARACVSSTEVVKHVVMETRALVPTSRPSPAKILSTKIQKLERSDDSFLFAQKLFLSGMGPFARSMNIIHIHKCIPNDGKAQAQLDAFEYQINRTKAARGTDGNVRYGWFGSKRTDIIALLIHGFGKAGKPIEGATFGTGIYLTPESRAFASVNLCDVDEKGMQCMMLCRVILGNTEQVQPRSKQYLPSSQDFDSGVDELLSPKRYIVWPAHMNYIHPEYVVTFMLAPHTREYLFGLKDVRFHVAPTIIAPEPSAVLFRKSQPVDGPVSPWISFAKLFEEINGSISPIAKELCAQHHEELRRNIITRAELVGKIRLIIGDRLVASVLRRFQHSPSSWYGVSGATSLVDPNAQKHDESADQNVEPNNSSAMERHDSAAPVIDLNVSASQEVELDDSAAKPAEPNPLKALSLKPCGSSIRGPPQ